LDNSEQNMQHAIVRFSDFPQYYALPIIKSFTDMTLAGAKNKLRFMEESQSTLDLPYRKSTIQLDACAHFAFSCHIILNNYSDQDLYGFINRKLSHLINSFRYLEMYCISNDVIYEHTYKSLEDKNEVWKEWAEKNLFKNTKYISLAFQLPKAEGQTLCNLVIFRS